MKYISEFRSGKIAQVLARQIHAAVYPDRTYSFMEFCGGHTHAIFRYGLSDLLPSNIRMVHGPGCPVCVLPMGRIDDAVALAQRPEVILCSYGDTMRVPGTDRLSLLKVKAAGAAVKMIYSPSEVLTIARANPGRQVVFFAIGFETTTPATALLIRKAAQEGLVNLSVFCNHVLTPAAIQNILQSPEVRGLPRLQLDGFVGPAHVSTVIGSRPYEYFAREFQRPVVIAGFEPLDLLQAIMMLVRQCNERRAVVEVQFTRAVTREGNLKAQELVAEIFELRRTFEWRGLGMVPYSALRIKAPYASFDAERRFSVTTRSVFDNPACACGAILRGVKRPLDCKLFGTVCHPENPVGSCMVSAEGACAAYYTYGRFKDSPVGAAT
ncbi:MAG: hydrogenase formation protein HypD [Cyanobacteria bacterium NC_groundwater_1444_Ag_S-0.65um_54_12]|nr:hydrogenase formation protein HypD [Cyanobacteria bacterium NC_groundwater_1444_Ag_S-0.65um_54_12]